MTTEAASETVNVIGMPEFDGLLDHIYEYGTAAEGVAEKANAFARAVIARYAPQQPAAAGDEIMVNTPYDVFTLPLQPSGLSSGPRFVVHVPGPEQTAGDAEAEALAKYQPCGCVICTCEDEKQCHGCGAKHCGNRTDHPPYVKQQPEQRAVEECPQGMNLRDHFAANALPATYRVFFGDVRAFGATVPEDWEMGIARDAYKLADAMLKAREASND